jgi:hypothetical protein
VADKTSSNASKVFLFAAIVLGVLAMVMAFAYIQTAANVDRVPKMKLVVAARDLPVNKVLNPEEDLKTIEIPQPVKPEEMQRLVKRMLDAAQMPSYKGKRINRQIYADGLIQLSDLGGQEVNDDVPAGMCEFGVSVRGANSLSGLIVPGDYVRLFVTRAKTGAGADDGGKWETIELLPNDPPLKVYATGTSLYRPRAGLTQTDVYQSTGNADAPQNLGLIGTTTQYLKVEALSGAGQEKLSLVRVAPPTSPGDTPSAGPSTRSH